MIRSVFVGLITFAYIFVIGTPFLLYGLLTRNTGPLYGVGVLGAKLALRLAGVRLVVRGLDRIPKDRAVVYMSNHQSNCDGCALFTLLPPLLIFAKKEFFSVPVLGRGMVLRGFVPVDRDSRGRALAAVEQAAQSLKAGNSFLVFPEGTRSPDGRLQAFKKGVFVMAIKAQVPIVPIAVSGSRKIMRKGDLAMHPGEVRITIENPIPTEGCTLDDRSTLMGRVRQAILQDLDPEELPLEPVSRVSRAPTRR